MKRLLPLLLAFSLSLTYLVAMPQSVSAANVTCADNTTVAFPVSSTPEQACAKHGGVSSGSQAQGANNGTDQASKCGANQVALSVPLVGNNNCIDNDPAKGGAIIIYLRLLLKFMAGLIGAVILLMLVIAGIQYITSAGDPGAIKGAKNRIINAITALVLFLSAYAILSFIVPGGIF